MILHKQWSTRQDISDDSVLGDLLRDLKRVSVNVLLENGGELQAETQAAFNLSSFICQTRQWEWPWAVRQALNNMGDSRTSKDIKVLDIGSGFRPFTLWLRDLGFDVTAVDNLSWDTKEDLAGMFSERDINFVNADATDLPFADASFDYSFCISVIEHCEMGVIEQIISEGRRVTKPGGLFIVTVDSCEKVKFLLPDEPIPHDVMSTFRGDPVAGVVFGASK